VRENSGSKQTRSSERQAGARGIPRKGFLLGTKNDGVYERIVDLCVEGRQVAKKKPMAHQENRKRDESVIDLSKKKKTKEGKRIETTNRGEAETVLMDLVRGDWNRNIRGVR